MKRWYGLLLPFFLSASFVSGYVAPQDRQYVDYFLRLQAAELFRKRSFLLNYSCAYVHGDRLSGVDLHFSYYRTLSINQSRKLLVGVAQELVARINQDPSLHERNLLPEPFTLDQIHLKIETDNVFSAQADIETVQRMVLDRGKIVYYSYPASTLFYGRITQFEETLEQARMMLGEKVPFSGGSAPKNDEPQPTSEPTPESPESSQEALTVAIDPPAAVPMTPVYEVKRMAIGQENYLELPSEASPVTKDLGGDNLLGFFFEKVSEMFPDPHSKVSRGHYHLGRVEIPSSPLPEPSEDYSPQHVAVKDIPDMVEGPQREEQRWTIAALPADTPAPTVLQQIETDQPQPENQLAAQLTPTPTDDETLSDVFQEEVDDSVEQETQPSSSKAAQEPLTIGLVVPQEREDQQETSLPQLVDDEKESALPLPAEGIEEPLSRDAAQPREEVDVTTPEEIHTEPWYRRVVQWVHGSPRPAEASVEPASSCPAPAVKEEDNERGDDQTSRDGSDAALPVDAPAFEQDGPEVQPSLEEMNDATDEPSSAPTIFQRIYGWFDRSLSQKPENTRMEQSPADDAPRTEQLPVHEEEEALSTTSQKTEEVEPEPAQPSSEKPSVMKQFGQWLRVAPRNTSASVEAAADEADSMPMEATASPPAEVRRPEPARGIVPPPELIDETQDDEALEEASVAPVYEKLIGWLSASKDSFSEDSAQEDATQPAEDAQPETTDQEAGDEPTRPWYARAMALFEQSSPEAGEQDIAYIPLTEEMNSAVQTEASLSHDQQSQPSEGWFDKVKAWAVVAPRTVEEKEPSAAQGSEASKKSALASDDRGDVDDGISWVERFSDWIRGDHFEDGDGLPAVSGGSIPEDGEAASSSRGSSDLAATLGEVDRPDQAWEEIENDINDDDDDETVRPGIMTRAFSAVHSFWQSAIGEPSVPPHREVRGESTASVERPEQISDAQQSS